MEKINLKNLAVFIIIAAVICSVPVGARYVSNRISGWQIIDDAIDSRHYVDDSIDDAHINWGNGTNQVNITDLEAGTDNILLDTEIDASSELLAIMDDETGTGYLVFNNSPSFTDDITLATDGVKLTGSGGTLTMLGLGTGADEDLKFDLNGTANEVDVTSTTGVTDFDLGTINLKTDLLDLGTNTLDDTNLGYIKGWEHASDNSKIDGGDLYPDSVDSAAYAAGSVDTEHLSVPKINVTSQSMAYSDFTDNGDATGYKDMTDKMPAGAIPQGFKAVVTTGFTGDTSATIQVGVSGDLDRFSSVTDQSVYSAGTVGAGAPADACDGMNAAQTIRVTVTSATDFTSVSAGEMTVYVYWIETA